jgi:hypothetical protein
VVGGRRTTPEKDFLLFDFENRHIWGDTTGVAARRLIRCKHALLTSSARRSNDFGRHFSGRETKKRRGDFLRFLLFGRVCFSHGTR